uniref:Reverse transcriptase domain-containing protein n=1 Tax=Nicotiana tabacum TaxID=4097 RepID=A0A1S4B211_TOBAC|nr:PREDICTED: uncharacterized protein LOC107803640 [Nicotiana tabacum]
MWINAGDQNTKFFHAHLKTRQAKNRIGSIYNDQGSTRNGPCLTKEQQRELNSPITEKDIDQALKEFPNEKAPVYKLIEKIITAKLKTVVDYVVGPSQSAFIKVRNILDNVIIAHELVKSYTKKGVSPRCLVKVDIRKAYDSVEWSFLKMILIEFGMPVKFVQLVMECVTTVSYSLLINGGLAIKFQAKKGLRQ